MKNIIENVCWKVKLLFSIVVVEYKCWRLERRIKRKRAENEALRSELERLTAES